MRGFEPLGVAAEEGCMGGITDGIVKIYSERGRERAAWVTSRDGPTLEQMRSSEFCEVGSFVAGEKHEPQEPPFQARPLWRPLIRSSELLY